MPFVNIQIKCFDAPSPSSWETGTRQWVTAILNDEPPAAWTELFDKEVVQRGGDLAESEPMIKKNTIVFFSAPDNARNLAGLFRELTVAVNIAYAATSLTIASRDGPFAP